MPTIRIVLLLLGFTLICAAQTITGTLTGSVHDPTGLTIAGAKVTVIFTATAAERVATTTERGDFVISGLAPGEYTVTVSQGGFHPTERRGIQLAASEFLSIGDTVLQVGSVSETLTVTGQAAAVQTASAERAGSITNTQVNNLLILNRNVMSLLQLLPGVVDTSATDSIDRNFALNVQGNRTNTNNVSIDGITMNAIGNNNNVVVGVSQDAVAEVKALLGNYQAEYGRMTGANISIVTKSGTQQFHGLVSYYKRHEQFNANNFFNNRLGLVKPRYRYNVWSYNIGGPVYIPGKFNSHKEKLFFFWSQEYWPLTVSQPVQQLTVPTALERGGDFSQSLDLNGKLIPVTDPTTHQVFPGNVVPANRLDKSGQALLKIFPAPNFTNRDISAGRYNYVFQDNNETPQGMQTAKLDYNANSSNLVMFNFSRYSDVRTGATGVPTSAANWPQLVKTYTAIGKLFMGRYTRIFSPTLINEMNVGYSDRPENLTVPDDSLKANQRDSTGFTTGQFHPESNPMQIVPNATFGGVTQPATLSTEGRFPLLTTHKILTFTDNVTKSMSAHTLKAGVYIDRIYRNASNPVNFNGSFSFDRNVNNSLDTGYAYANAALGVFNSYTEASGRPFLHYRVGNTEFFAQDNWKVTRRLTLDLGMRFSLIPPLTEQDDLVSGFVPARFDPKQAPALIAPAMVGGQRVGVNPVNGAVYPAALIGALAPGSGNSTNGMVVPARDSSIPRAFIPSRGLQLGPRIGFAFDPTGKGKMALRGGFGMFYNRLNLDSVLNPYSVQTPLVDNPVVNFGTLPTLLSTSGLLQPQSVLGVDGIGKLPTVMNYSVSVQRNVGFGTVVDVGYIGALGRHLMWQRNLNSIPFGANFDPKNADPTNPKVPLQSQFLRPLMGYGDVNLREYASSSNYHSLQVTANRRFQRGLQMGASWTWSKAMDYNSGDTNSVSTLVAMHVWNYGLSTYDRTHLLKVNWIYDLPSTPWKTLPAKYILNGWQISGVASFISGSPVSVGFSTVNSVDITGSPTDSARIVVTGNPVLPKSERTFSRNFQTDVFKLPPVGTIGNAARTQIRGPGINNWDTALFKTIPLYERMRLQFRMELYNAFNHTQFSAYDSTARFDATGNQVNARFGEFTAARNPRVIQFALKFLF